MIFHPTIDIRVHHYPGYGSSAPESWSIRVIYKNILLDAASVRTSRDAGKAEAKFEVKWDHEWNKIDFFTAIQGKPLASMLCSHCGLDTLDGTHQCVERIFCNRCAAAGVIDKAIAEYDEKQEQYKRERDQEEQVRQLAEQAKVYEAQTGFHWRDGWYFKRMVNGVRISLVEINYLKEQETIPFSEWASIIASIDAAIS